MVQGRIEFRSSSKQRQETTAPAVLEHLFHVTGDASQIIK